MQYTGSRVCYLSLRKSSFAILTLFDMGFFEPSVRGRGSHFVAIASMIMKFDTGISLMYSTQWSQKVCDVTTLRNYDFIICILASS